MGQSCSLCQQTQNTFISLKKVKKKDSLHTMKNEDIL